MGLSKQQMDQLVENVQYLLDNPVRKIEWDKIDQEFARLLEQNIEYDEEEIQHIERKLSLPKGVEVTAIFVIADELLMNYKFDKGIKLQMIEFEKEMKKLLTF